MDGRPSVRIERRGRRRGEPACVIDDHEIINDAASGDEFQFREQGTIVLVPVPPSASMRVEPKDRRPLERSEDIGETLLGPSDKKKMLLRSAQVLSACS